MVRCFLMHKAMEFLLFFHRREGADSITRIGSGSVEKGMVRQIKQ